MPCIAGFAVAASAASVVVSAALLGASVDRGEDWKNFTIVAIILKFYVSHIFDHNIKKTGSDADQSTNISNLQAGVSLPGTAVEEVPTKPA